MGAINNDWALVVILGYFRCVMQRTVGSRIIRSSSARVQVVLPTESNEDLGVLSHPRKG